MKTTITNYKTIKLIFLNIFCNQDVNSHTDCHRCHHHPSHKLALFVFFCFYKYNDNTLQTYQAINSMITFH